MRFLVFTLFLSSCSIFIGGKDAPKTAKGTRYSITYRETDWEQKKDKRSDYVFENKRDGRILLSNSFCDEFQEGTLDQLAKKTFNTISDFKRTSGEFKTFNNREAYELRGSGFVDGVKVGLRILNTRRDNCYFDFLSIDPLNSNEDKSFVKFLEGVEFR